MKTGSISTDPFSYKEDISLRLTISNYVLAIKEDEEFRDRNIIPIIYFDNGKVRDIDKYDMERIVVIPHKTIKDKSLSRFNTNQLIKVSSGNIYHNDRYYEGSRLPKCATIDTYIYPTDKNDVVEIFNGIIDEARSRIKLSDSYLDSLILDVYVEQNAPVFIETDGKLIGPFKIIRKDTEGYFNVEINYWKPFGEYELTNETYIEFTENKLTRKIHLPSFNKLKLLKTINFIDNDELLKSFKSTLLDNSKDFDNTYIEHLLEILHKIHKIKSIDEYVSVNKRIADILQNTEKVIISNKELALLIPEIKNVKSEIDSLRNEKFSIKNEIDRLSTRKDEINQDINEKTEKLHSLNSDLENLSKTKEEELRKIKSELETNIGTLQAQKDKLEEKINFETETKSKELILITDRISKLKKEEEDLTEIIQELQRENKKVHKDALEALTNVFRHKTYSDFLSGRDLSEFDKQEEKSYNNYALQNDFDNYLDFRNELVAILEKNGRKFDTHFIDNLLISIHQNTLTVFAGLPGTGKTSLARILTKTFAPEERVSEVSVSRGWSSQKDLIGFQNPLTNKFHSAPTGIYELLTQLDYESKNSKYLDSPMAYIILDEANLSPIEHYWSAFYNLTDSTAKQNSLLSISLGNRLTLEFPNNLRFIATINYDQTTESLSPRVIDRANIIQIPSNSYNIESASVEEVKRIIISYQKCIDFFNLCDFQEKEQNIQLSDELNILFNDIKKRFTALRTPISPRVEIAIKRYCAVGKNLMKEISRPLDYCIAQRLLPMLNLQGDSARKGLEDLLVIFENNELKKSSEILSKIIETGNENNFFEGNYNYFFTLTYA